MNNHNITEVQILRGSSGSNASYVGRPGVLTADLDTSAILNRGIVRIHDGATPGGYIIGGAGTGGGGSETYTNTTPVPTTLGGITAGSTFSSVPLTEMFDRLLYPYQTPTFSAFSISGQSTTLEVGDQITAGTKTFTWTTTNSSNVSSSGITISDFTNSTTIASGLANTGTSNQTIVAVSKSSATSHVYRISAKNTQDTTFTRDFTVSWRWRMYWGTASLSSLTETDIESLISSSLVSTSAGSFNFGTAGYKYIAYPTVFGLKTSFKDANTGFDVDMQSAVTTAVSNSFGAGTNYYVHRSTNVLGGSITITVS